MKKRILYISGSLGLGHVTRDLAIAKELRTLRPESEIVWLAAHPADLLIKEAGETLLPGSHTWVDETVVAEEASDGYRLNLLKYAFRIKKVWADHLQTFRRLMQEESFDVVVGDETYEIAIALTEKSLKIDPAFVMIYDFIGTEAMTYSPVERLGVYFNNRKWARSHRDNPYPIDLVLFVGELDDVVDKRFGFLLPNRREWAKKICKFVGYILRFKPEDLADKMRMRRMLGYGGNPLIVCSIGGTSIGKAMLELCGKAFPILRRTMPDLRMVLVSGPRLSPESVTAPAGVEIRGYVPDLFEHFAASDLAIVQAGGTTTLELTALRKPFIYFPIEGQFGQQLYISERLARHRAGVKMQYSRTTPESLAEMVLAHIGKELNYAAIPTDGARRAAEFISGLLG